MGNAIIIAPKNEIMWKGIYTTMPSLSDFSATFLDTLTGHLALAVYLLAVTDERAVWMRLKKLPPLLGSPFITTLLSAGLYAVPELRAFQYFIVSFAVLIMCALWVRWAWQFSFRRAFAATCMAGIFQVAGSALSWMPWSASSDGNALFVVAIGLHLGVCIAVTALLYRLRFGA